MKYIKLTLFLLISLVGFASCSSELDLSQLNSLRVTPTFEASLFYVKAEESLINSTVGNNFFAEDFNFDAFQEPYFSNRVIEGNISYELNNSTSKPIEVTLEFLNNKEDILYAEVFTLSIGPSDLSREVTFGDSGKSLDIIKETSKIRFSALNLGDNLSSSVELNSAIIFKSSGKFTVQSNEQ